MRKFWIIPVAIVTMAITILVGRGGALADAPDPVPTAAVASLGPDTVIGSTHVRTVTVSGNWIWSTHGSTDCNFDRAGVGYAVDWGDPNQAGNHVATLSIANGGSIDVGALAANAYNPSDNEIHPTAAEAGTNTVFNDPNVSPPTTTSVGIWRSGCGHDSNGSASGGKPTGTWGPISHVYTVTALQQGITICAITYDVHGSDANSTKVVNGFAGGVPNGVKEITAGGSSHNGDNGAEKNANTPLGNTCVPIQLPPDLTPIKTADAAVVDAGQQIGFVVSVKNNGGSSTSGVIDDDLPTGAGITWSIAATASGVSCSFTGSPPPQHLHCTLPNMAAGATLANAVHVTSPTTLASSQVSGACPTPSPVRYNNTATATATNQATAESSSAYVDVNCPSTVLTKTIAPENMTVTIIYTFVEKNDGNVDLNIAQVSDPSCTSAVSPASATIAVGASQTFTCTRTVTLSATGGLDQVFPNTATGSAVTPGGTSVVYCSVASATSGQVCDPDEQDGASFEVKITN